MANNNRIIPNTNAITPKIILMPPLINDAIPAAIMTIPGGIPTPKGKASDEIPAASSAVPAISKFIPVTILMTAAPIRTAAIIITSMVIFTNTLNTVATTLPAADIKECAICEKIDAILITLLLSETKSLKKFSITVSIFVIICINFARSASVNFMAAAYNTKFIKYRNHSEKTFGHRYRKNYWL